MMLMAMTKPKYVIPTGGTHRHNIQYGKLAMEMGIPQDHILMPENQSIVIAPGGVVHFGDSIDLKNVYVESGLITQDDKSRIGWHKPHDKKNDRWHRKQNDEQRTESSK
jgi:mRNA degradation ribonuclease J1/J2